MPVDIELGSEYDTLVITGPNTGGKTVSLKTAGLLNAMAQYGFLIPAHESSIVCHFDEYLVDIGDEQSIEQSLSTFSGHMKRISGILDLAGHATLTLLDELGAGTDLPRARRWPSAFSSSCAVRAVCSWLRPTTLS